MDQHQKEVKAIDHPLIAAGMALARVHANPHQGGRSFVFAPKPGGGVEIVYLEAPDHPARKSGTITVKDVDSFIEATERHKDNNYTVVYASLQPVQFTAVLNDHQSGELAASDYKGGQFRDHRVVFPLEHSKEWLLWEKQDGKHFEGQEAFAYFIEDNLPDFQKPAGAAMLDIALNFRAKVSVSYKGATRLQNGSVELNYTETVEGNAGPSGRITIPEEFTLMIPVWAGLDQEKHQLEARLRYRVQGGQLRIWYDLNRPHKVVEKAFAKTLHKIETTLGDKTPIVFGAPGEVCR